MENSVYIRKRYLLACIVVFFLLLALPLTVYIAQQQSQSQSQAVTTPTPTDVPQVCTEAKPRDIILVFDNSASMLKTDGTSSTRLDKAKSAASKFIDKFATLNQSLRTSQKYHLGLVEFTDYSNTTTVPAGYPGGTGKTKILRNPTTDMNGLKAGVNALTPPDTYGWTCIECGLNQAFVALNNVPRDSDTFVILLTDGEANWREVSKPGYVNGNFVYSVDNYGDVQDYLNDPSHDNDLSRAAVMNRLKQRNGAIVHTIGVGEADRNFLLQVASSTNGKSVYSSNGSNLDSIYDSLYRDLTVGDGTITGTVFEDKDADKLKETGEDGKAGMTVTVYDANGNVVKTGVTDSNGNFSVSGLCPGQYKIQQSDPNGWTASTTNPVNVPLGTSSTGTFLIGVYFPYSIRGNVYLDNGNGTFDSSDSVYSGPVRILYDGSQISTIGSFVKNNVPQGGKHTISLDPNSVTGFTIKPGSIYTIDVTTYPFADKCPSIIPSSYASYGGRCDKHTVIINFLISGGSVSAKSSWIQSEGLDVRIDIGYDFPIPNGSSCAYASIPGNSSTPGVIFSGNQNPDFGVGTASVKGWQVGNQSYPEVFKSSQPLKLSYAQALIAAEKTRNVKTLFTQNLNTTPSGIYKVNGPLVITDSTKITNNKSLIILVDGDVAINNTISVDKGSFLLIISHKSISIAGAIGTIPACSGAQSQLDGFYVADHNITILSDKSCAEGGDTMLQAAGTFVVNASRTGGAFVQKRTLCGSSAVFPPFRVNPRLDMVLSFPDFLKVTSRTWHEVAP